ncbi:Aste57867_22941 [Aphanomyces stellatus]|uniref:subtilisin n=1 Tax=Aphanomyces stellatus TaxID=120398 RepID=A0A485LMZ5_9STRA|nr:hypothetical protein As57867_022870 [Aphanomyces stellatus]VFT99591.1 Aste57867_22941 [Aphanomyces stellatus]
MLVAVLLQAAATVMAAQGTNESPLRSIFDGLGISTTGKASVVGITDSGIYLHHSEFSQSSPNPFNRFDLNATKLVFYETFADDKEESVDADGTCGHGTHVAGILAGRTIGAAPDAKIAFLDIAYLNAAGKMALKTPQSPLALFQNQTKAGAKVISFSWGTDSTWSNDLVAAANDDYNGLAKDIDAYLYDHPGVLLVTAAGNNGETGPKSLLSPGGAKNVLTVGATFTDALTFDRVARETGPLGCADTINMDTVPYFSARGPTQDGRIKPDVVVPGMYLVSARSFPYNVSNASTNDTCRKAGTSQATPLAASLAVLVFEWLGEGVWFNGTPQPQYKLAFVPSSLVKALIVHTATPVRRRLPYFDNTTTCSYLQSDRFRLKTYPDANQGYGRPNLTSLWAPNGVYFVPNHTGVMPSLTTGFEHSYLLTVVKPQRLRVTIVWTDAPAVPGNGGRALTNNLDLSLRLAGDMVLHPLSGNAQPDALNNVEVIDISWEELEAAVPRSLIQNDRVSVVAKVAGTNVPKGPQLYSIVSTAPLQLVDSKSMSTAAKEETTSCGSNIAKWVAIGGGIALVCVLAAFFAVVFACRKTHPSGERQTMHESLRGLLRLKETCRKCGFQTPNTVALAEHIEDAHRQPQKCPRCHFTSANPDLLASHVVTFH